jgi:hypothetical protein
MAGKLDVRGVEIPAIEEMVDFGIEEADTIEPEFEEVMAP